MIILYGFIVARGLRAALGSRDPFGKLLAAGLAFVFAIQVFAIIGGVTRLLPLTGLTTPFMSQGGSSLVANWVMIGLLLLITHQVRRPSVEPMADPVASLAGEATQVISAGSLARPSAADAIADDETGPLPAFADAPTGPIPSVSPDALTGPLPAVGPHAETDAEATTSIRPTDGGVA